VRPRNEPRHRLVSLKDARRLTGLSPEQLLRQPDTQLLVRVGEDGTREELIRLPIELLRPPESAPGDAEDTPK
jgi:hypothetical protein